MKPHSLLFSRRRLPSALFGFVWWRWSALIALSIRGVEMLFLILVAFGFGQVEFSWIAAPFVGFAVVLALTADALLILMGRSRPPICQPLEEGDAEAVCGFPQNENELFFMFPKAEFPLTPPSRSGRRSKRDGTR